MSTVNGLPAHILLVHAIVVLLPLSAVLLVLSAGWDRARRRLAGANALLAALVELGDTALFVAIPVALLALVVWWRQRESRQPAESDVDGATGGGTTTMTKNAVRRKTFLAPASKVVTTVITVLAVLVAGGACYQIYRIGDSGAQASWQGKFSSEPTGRPGR
jgi:hypothetical protein